MAIYYGAATLIGLALALLFYSPYLADLAAGAMEGTARMFRRHATAMRAAYAAYGESWRKQAVV